MTNPPPMTDDLVGRLREREQQEREIAANSEVVFELLKPQLDIFNARTGGHNTYAVRMALDHRNSAKKDAAFADTLTEAIARIEALEAENGKLRADLIAQSDDGTVAICEKCGARLFDGDDFVSDPEGQVSGCWSSMTDIVPKRERPCFAYRVALTPEAPHAD